MSDQSPLLNIPVNPIGYIVIYILYCRFPSLVRCPAANNLFARNDSNSLRHFALLAVRAPSPPSDPGAKRATGPLAWGGIGFPPFGSGRETRHGSLVRG